MKKYLLYILMAFAAISFTSCEDDAVEMGTTISTDPATLSFNGQGAAAQTVSVLANGDWIAVAPEWITVTPNYGSGNTTVTVTVADNLDTDGTLAAERTGDLSFSLNGTPAVVSVSQTGDPDKTPVKPAKITIADFNAAPEDATVFYEITGTISGIKNTYYGNFYLADETGSVYVYGLGDPGTFESLGLSEGDLLTMCGYRGSYGSTIEVMGGYYVSHVASLISATPAEVSLPIEGGSFEIAMAYKGETFEISIDDAAKSWLNMGTIKPDGDTTRVSFSATANAGGLREATISFTSVKGSVTSTVTTVVTQEGSIADKTVADFIAASEGTALYRLSGKIKSIVSAVYGNFYLEDATGEVYVYGLTSTCIVGQSNDKSFASLGLKAGDIVTIVGTRASYNNQVQVGGPAYYESHVSSTEATVAQFLSASTGDAYYKLTGTIEDIKSADYGNFNLKDETGTVYVYGLTKAPVAKNDKSFASLNLKAGDKVTIIGKRAEYNGTAQVGSAYYISHEAQNVGGDNGGGSAAAITWTIGSANQTWVADSVATYGSGFKATDKGITVGYYKYNNNNPAKDAYADHIRVYQGSALVISATDGKAIKKVVLECTGADYTAAITVGGNTVAPSGTTITWSGNTTSFEAVTSAQIRVKSLSVTLVE